MILVKNITTNTEMKVKSSKSEFITAMSNKPSCNIALSQTGRYLMVLNGVLMRLEISEI